MRLSQSEIAIIKKTIGGRILDAVIYLFGSRTDDSKRGGDIDLFVQTKQNITLRDEIALLANFERHGIARKVDLLIQTPERESQNIYQTILAQGVRL